MSRPIIGLLFFFSLLFFSPTNFAQSLSVAIIDTGFCIEKLNHSSNIKLQTPHDTTHSVKIDCNKIEARNRRFHGHYVLKEFIQFLGKEVKVKIYPIIIFDNQAKQSIEYWQKATAFIKEQSIDLIISAAGLPDQNASKKSWPSVLTFLSSGRLGIGIDKDTKLYPQELSHTMSSIILVGSYYPESSKNLNDQYFDKNLLYQNQLKLLQSDGKPNANINGSSRAVAEAAGKFLSQCSKNLDLECLKKNIKRINLYDSKLINKSSYPTL